MNNKVVRATHNKKKNDQSSSISRLFIRKNIFRL